jgi:bis(5'-nucleosyl)-tetraphosphatase (symmetrical)
MLHHDDHSGFTMVHAGIPPQWDLATARACAEELEGVLRSDDYGTFFSNMYGDEPDIWRDDLKGWDRLRYITNCLTRMRYCDSQGRLLIKVKGPLGSQPQGYMPWFDVSGRASQSMNIVFGHWASLGWYEGDGVYGVDSGCVWGGELSALCLDDMSRTSVKCEGICDIGES